MIAIENTKTGNISKNYLYGNAPKDNMKKPPNPEYKKYFIIPSGEFQRKINNLSSFSPDVITIMTDYENILITVDCEFGI